ncbi:MAG: MarR family transcriptional regulator [Rhodospirillales bacterium]|nr:MarR family transcriptional regulator [Alphaproteobacteria bacterium]MBL6929095.1 MarR family transcriptional regulator [Rhodospirillales bacterium]
MNDPKPQNAALAIGEDELRQAIELLFFAYRDFTAEPDEILAQYGFGRAHHRVIYFVGRNPGVTVSDLLGILRITKQSLSRVLGQLLREDFVTQKSDMIDRRKRHLNLTEKGRDLEATLTNLQSRRIAQAYAYAGADTAKEFRKVLHGIINENDRDRVATLDLE